MSRLSILAFLISLICLPPLLAGDDVNFGLKLTRDTRLYHLGEPIEFELSYTSETPQKYLIGSAQPIPEFKLVTLHLSPSEGFWDLEALRQCVGMGGSFLSGGPQYLSSKPIQARTDLQRWYRFQKPGHYALTMTSRAVWRTKSAEEGGGQDSLTLESNSVEFDILPADTSWQADEMRRILSELDNAKAPGERDRAQYELTLLDTAESVLKLVDLFLSTSYPEKYGYDNALRSSSRTDLIVSTLEKALSDPQISPIGVTQLLADLQVRRQLGLPRIVQDNSQAGAQCEERRKLHDEYLAKDDALLLERIRRAPGPLQAEATYEAWFNAERGQPEGSAPQSLSQLRLEALNSAQKLQPDRQTQLLIFLWKVLPHEQLLPLIRSVASAGMLDAYRLWCEGWPDECAEAIVSDVFKPGTQISTPVVLMISEKEHPELDSPLKDALTGTAMLQESASSVRIAAVVLRAGSRNLLSAADNILTQSNAAKRFNCQVQGYLLGYLFRVAPEHAQSRLAENFQNEKCGNQLFHILNLVRPSQEIVPVALNALNSSDLAIAGHAALFLGEHGPAAVQDALWQRLDALWNLWHDQAAELRNDSPQPGVQREAGLLEQSLASALAHATNWKLSSAEQDRLRSGCLTEQCRRIAEGKMRLEL